MFVSRGVFKNFFGGGGVFDGKYLVPQLSVTARQLCLSTIRFLSIYCDVIVYFSMKL